MTDNVQITLGTGSLGQRLDWFFADAGLESMPYALRRSRLPQVLHLEARSDRELARMGLRRDQILSHVFRDLVGAV